ncbi:MAG: hypothetical protein EKK64_05575 [Neisseriaceae bacterium]|nr:MAG: hypothetical protein EKK64_05575 [Neisseriaceae bacterium]
MNKQNTSALALILFFTVLHAIPLSILNLGYDEAYYWQWSQHLAMGYFDHPPMIAYFIYISEKLFGSSPLAVRAPVLFGNIIISSCLYIITHKLSKSHKSGLIAIALFNILPIFALGQIMITPDIPQITFISLSLLISYFIFEEKKSHVLLWILLGLGLGCAMMSKYTSMIFIGVIYANILFNPKYQYLLKSYKPYLSIIFIILAFAPNLYWNDEHNWDSFLFQFYNRQNSHINHLGSFFGFVGLQFAITGFFMFFFIPVIYKDVKKNGVTLLNSLAISPVLIFTIISMLVKMRFYWAMLSYLPMIILFARDWQNYKKTFFWLFAIDSILISIIVVHLYAPLVTISRPQGDAYGDLNGWPELSQAIDGYIQSQPNPNNWIVISNDFHVAASTDYNLRGKYTVYSLPANNKREGNYYWQNDADLLHKNAIIVVDSMHNFNPEELYNCQSLTKYKDIDVTYKGTLYRQLSLYTCTDFINRK